MNLNLTILRKVLAQPWAVMQTSLAVFVQMVLAGAAPVVREKQAASTKPPRKLAGYVPLNEAARDAVTFGSVPPVREGVTVLQVWGTLGRGWTELEKYWFDAVEVDDITAAIEATPEGSTVVLWFRSPGGIITGVLETAAALRKLGAKRTLLAFTDDLCASAAYWLASQCQSITATPTAEVGSIGVYVAMYDYTQYLEKMGVSLNLFRAGNMKGAGLMGHELTEEEGQHIQRGVDEAYILFTKDVLRNREIGAETMQGQTLNGKNAKAANLVDAFAASAREFLR